MSCVSLIDGRSVDVQYSNWQNGYPINADTPRCVVVTQPNEWLTYDCNTPQRYVCQSQQLIILFCSINVLGLSGIVM